MTGDPAYVRIQDGEPLPEISHHAPFLAVVVIEAPFSQEWQDKVSDWLVGSGCLYMMAWGPACSTWDDSVDWANIRQFDPDEIPDESFVLTSWHETETLEEVFWFAKFAAYHGVVELKSTLIVHISAWDGQDDIVARYAAQNGV